MCLPLVLFLGALPLPSLAELVDINEPALIPMPAYLSWGKGHYVMPSPLAYTLEGDNRERLQSALQRWQTQLPLSQQLDEITAVGEKQAALRIVVAEPGAAYPQPGTDETYTLTIDADGIELQATTTYGALHGLQTLLQLAESCAQKLCFPRVAIRDQPQFAWRGILIDVVRHWMPPEVIKRQLDAMASVKMNVLHWHLSDDQSFRVQSKVYPRLHEQGSDGNYYTQQQVRELVDYAADRGIRVMPEFDLPGHSRSWQIAYPMLASRPGQDYKLYATDSIFSDPIDPSREEVYDFIAGLTAEMAGLFPDPYFHLGGDEVNTDAWEDSDAINAFMEEQGIDDYAALQAYFVQRYAAIIAAEGKTAVGWNEVLHPKLPNDVVLHLWNSTDFPAEVEGRPLLLSTNYYLDHVRSAESHYRNPPFRLTVDGALAPGLSSALMGIEAASWAEIIDPWNIDICIWPRTAAIAERMWSPLAYTDAVDMNDVYLRMEAHSRRLERLGMRHVRNRELEMQELAAGADPAPLLILSEQVQPMMFYPMLSWEAAGYLLLPWLAGEMPDQPTPLQPFTRVLAYESLPAWHFNQRAQAYLANPGDTALETSLLDQLRRWSGNHPAVLPLVAANPTLQEVGVDELSYAASQLASIGIAALEARRGERELSDGEREEYGEILEEFAPPPYLFSRDMLWFLVGKLFQPAAYKQHTFAIQPGVAALLNASSPEN